MINRRVCELPRFLMYVDLVFDGLSLVLGVWFGFLFP